MTTGKRQLPIRSDESEQRHPNQQLGLAGAANVVCFLFEAFYLEETVEFKGQNE